MRSCLAEFSPPKGRGSVENPGNRFEQLRFEADPEAVEDLRTADEDFQFPKPQTNFLHDESQSIISKNTSPDIGFEASLNPYRGCEHGCSYCYARPFHEFLGFNAGLDFETQIMVKKDAPELLMQELNSPRWDPTTLACSGVTDCYQPIERELEITRRCLGVLAEFRNPVSVVTKNHLVTRDLDHLAELAHYRAASVYLSVTTLDRNLSQKMEPRASTPQFRLRAIRELSEAGIPVGVSVAPVIPGLNDHEIPMILEAAREQGASFATFTAVRLPYGVGDIFLNWLERHFPDQRAKIEGRVRELRGGRLNDPRFGSRMRGEGPLAQQMRAIFSVSARRLGLLDRRPNLSTSFFRRRETQLELF